MSVAIQVENLSKAYQLGEIGTGTISRDIERWWAKVRGKEDPFLKIGQTNDRTSPSTGSGENDVVWSLKDINFEIEQGQAVGIIGRNGAGKSTLLKILSRVTSPTTGSIKLKGRVASLLEVGTGFHPELTGRENIFLNGAILGMRKTEIIRKFDEIVDFAGVERYIDTPVKRYSSGMYVRLAFAVAAHLESEILIVDEVLAVGDAEFQKKCLGKMGDVSSKEGRTVLFVSHNMGAVKSLCQTGILLKNGEVDEIGGIDLVINQYSNYGFNEEVRYVFDGNLKSKIEIKNIKINSKTSGFINVLPSENIEIEMLYETKEEFKELSPIISLYVDGIRLFTMRENLFKKTLDNNTYKSIFEIKKYFLRPGKYSLAIGIWANYQSLWLWGTDILSITVEEVWDEKIRKYDEGIFNIY